jgi:hypothetical protein
VPVTFAAQVAVCAVVMDAGVARTATLVTAIVGGGAVTVTVAEPVMSAKPACAELAVQVAVPGPDGVSTPAEVIVPPVAVQLTAELYPPLPVTAAVQVAVCTVAMVAGVAATATLVMAGRIAEVEIATAAAPDFVESCVEVALTESNPEAGALEGAV